MMVLLAFKNQMEAFLSLHLADYPAGTMKKKKKKGSPRHATFKRLILHNREMQTIGKCIPGKVFEQWSDNAQCEN